MIPTLLTSYLLGSLLISLLLALYLLFRIKSDLSDIEIQLLANNLKLKNSIKEQIIGGIDFHLRELSNTKPSKLLQDKRK